ncbi:MAG: acyl-CoA synthetase [Gammaproteobacteria bacterium]|nr:acyl-CoA synthetase [Gammaproteobacteria bacterium]
MSIFEQQLPRTAANYVPLTPVSFLQRAAQLRPAHLAVVHGDRRYSYRQFYQRSCQLGLALRKRGVGVGDCVAIMGANTPEMLEAHNGVPMIGAVLNSLNIRLDATTIAFILNHGEAKVLLTDREFSPVIREALPKVERELLVIDIDDPLNDSGELLGEMDYEQFLASADLDPDSEPDLSAITDEWQAISLLYTSGTTGNPKGCVYHHRGAYLNALGNMTTMGLTHQSRYLWTLPMFHCDGWTFTWGVTAAMATHVCCRKVDPALVFNLIGEHDVTHMCGAPIVLNMLANAPAGDQRRASNPVEIATGGAAPPSAVIEAMEAIGFSVTHLYGLTETYGPATVCLPQDDWPALELEQRSARMARQGVHYLTLDNAKICDPVSCEPVPADGETIGELMIRGNTVMKGYLKNTEATDQAFDGGWFHTGDLGVQHPDGYVEIKDRAKDIIISGGENVSTLEVEEALYRHPKILEAAVVAKPDETWGETPCAFVTLREGEQATAEEIIDFCRETMARFKVPRTVVFGSLPKTSTGKIQKFALREQAAALQD